MSLELVALSFISDKPKGVTVGDAEAAFERPMQDVLQTLWQHGDLKRYEGGVFVLSAQGRRRLSLASKVLS